MSILAQHFRFNFCAHHSKQLCEGKPPTGPGPGPGPSDQRNPPDDLLGHTLLCCALFPLNKYPVAGSANSALDMVA